MNLIWIRAFKYRIPSLIRRHRHRQHVKWWWTNQKENGKWKYNNNWTLAASMVKWPIIIIMCAEQMHGRKCAHTRSATIYFTLILFAVLLHFGSVGYCLLLTEPGVRFPGLMLGLRVCAVLCSKQSDKPYTKHVFFDDFLMLFSYFFSFSFIYFSFINDHNPTFCQW